MKISDAVEIAFTGCFIQNGTGEQRPRYKISDDQKKIERWEWANGTSGVYYFIADEDWQFGLVDLTSDEWVVI